MAQKALCNLKSKGALIIKTAATVKVATSRWELALLRRITGEICGSQP
jgi:hypothetical protein